MRERESIEHGLSSAFISEQEFCLKKDNDDDGDNDLKVTSASARRQLGKRHSLWRRHPGSMLPIIMKPLLPNLFMKIKQDGPDRNLKPRTTDI